MMTFQIVDYLQVIVNMSVRWLVLIIDHKLLGIDCNESEHNMILVVTG